MACGGFGSVSAGISDLVAVKSQRFKSVFPGASMGVFVLYCHLYLPLGQIWSGIMKTSSVVAWGVTILVVAAAAGLGFQAYERHRQTPWTRDGQVQADIVLITPRVSGQVDAVQVTNNQFVHAGEELVRIDPAPYQLALKQAQAGLAQAQALEDDKAALARRAEGARRIDVQAISPESMQQATDGLRAAVAAREGAQAAVDRAQLDLSYTTIVAPADGYVTNVTLRPGAFAAQGEPLFALIDTSTFRVTGFFRETLLSGVKPGTVAEVTLMAYPNMPVRGEVVSVDWGISRNNGSTGHNLLPVVSPTFDWVRLAQRVPVNIRLTDIPADVELRVGLTASVQVKR